MLAFRYCKNIHSESGKDLSDEDALKLPQHMYFQMFVDPIMSYSEPILKKEIGFMPIDEPLLKYAFEDKINRQEVKEFGKKLLLPAANILLATKIKSSIDRDLAHKLEKDICDIAALCLFSDIALNDLLIKSKKILNDSTLRKFRKLNLDEQIKKCSSILGIEINIIKSIIAKIKE